MATITQSPEGAKVKSLMSYTNLKYHIVFSTKRRGRFLSPDIQPRLVKYIGGIVRNLNSILIEANGPEDHLHVVASIHPKLALSDFVRDIKANATRWMRRTFADLKEFGWQDEYSAFTVSQSQLSAVVDYVRRQVEHHKTLTFDEELRTLLRKHGIEFDDRYL